MAYSENEVPAGAVNSTDGTDGNGTFTLAFLPSDPTRVKLWVGGLRLQLLTQFTLAGTILTIPSPYKPVDAGFGSAITVDYPY